MPPSERVLGALNEVMFDFFNTGSLKWWWFMSLVETAAFFWLITNQLKSWSLWVIFRVLSSIWSVFVLAHCWFYVVHMALWKCIGLFLSHQTYRLSHTKFLLEFPRQDQIFKIVWIPSDFMWIFYSEKKLKFEFDHFDPDFVFFWSYSLREFNPILWISILSV